MKKMLFLLLFIPFFSVAQKNKLLETMLGLKSDSNLKYVSLPPLWRSDFFKLYEIGQYSSYKYLVRDDSTYYNIFSRYHKDSLPFFDFTKRELVVSIACSQCLVVCKHDRYSGNEPCHRNACRYSDIWFVRDKRKELIVDE